LPRTVNSFNQPLNHNKDIAELKKGLEENHRELREIQEERTTSKNNSFVSWETHPKSPKVREALRRIFKKFSKKTEERLEKLCGGFLRNFRKKLKRRSN